MEEIDDRVVIESVGVKFKEQYIYLPSEGASGGILLAVNGEYYTIKQSHMTGHAITAEIESTMAPISWWITVVYGPQGDNEKLAFLQELKELKNVVAERWLILGDFNMILQPEDKSSDNLNHRIMGAFREAMDSMQIREIKLLGRKYTWTNNRVHTRIDRAFCTVEWEMMLPSCELQADSSASSDHCPLILVGDVQRTVYRSFKFESFWPKIPGYREVVAEAWNHPTGVHNAFLNLHIKMQRTAKKLKQWAKSKIGRNRLLMTAAKKLIAVMEIAQDHRPLSNQEIALKQELKHRLLGLAAVEKLRLRQQSRLTWIKASDACSKLFFLSANGRKRKNHIRTLHTQQGQLHTHQDKEKAIYDHFSSVFGEPEERNITLDWDRIGMQRHNLQHLEENFTEEEVKAGIMSLPGERAPGPDGYIGIFFRSAWEIIKQDILTAINLFCNRQRHQFNLLNSGHIVLIPKTLRSKEDRGLQTNQSYT